MTTSTTPEQGKGPGHSGQAGTGQDSGAAGSTCSSGTSAGPSWSPLSLHETPQRAGEGWPGFTPQRGPGLAQPPCATQAAVQGTAPRQARPAPPGQRQGREPVTAHPGTPACRGLPHQGPHGPQAEPAHGQHFRTHLSVGTQARPAARHAFPVQVVPGPRRRLTMPVTTQQDHTGASVGRSLSARPSGPSCPLGTVLTDQLPAWNGSEAGSALREEGWGGTWAVVVEIPAGEKPGGRAGMGLRLHTRHSTLNPPCVGSLLSQAPLLQDTAPAGRRGSEPQSPQGSSWVRQQGLMWGEDCTITCETRRRPRVTWRHGGHQTQLEAPKWSSVTYTTAAVARSRPASRTFLGPRHHTVLRWSLPAFAHFPNQRGPGTHLPPSVSSWLCCPPPGGTYNSQGHPQVPPRPLTPVSPHPFLSHLPPLSFLHLPQSHWLPHPGPLSGSPTARVLLEKRGPRSPHPTAVTAAGKAGGRRVGQQGPGG